MTVRTDFARMWQTEARDLHRGWRLPPLQSKNTTSLRDQCDSILGTANFSNSVPRKHTRSRRYRPREPQGHDNETSVCTCSTCYTKCARSMLVALSTTCLSKAVLTALAIGSIASKLCVWGAEVEVMLLSIHAISRLVALYMSDRSLLLPGGCLRWIHINALSCSRSV